MPHRNSALTRRRFLLGTGAWAAGAALPGMVLARAPTVAPAGTGAPAATGARLVVVILRGALDGLAAVPPYADPNYAGLRGELALAAPGAADGVLPLDGAFGLHPSLGFLHDRYTAGELIVFQAVSSPYRDRSHFDGQNVLENGLTKPIGSADGWLNRAVAALPRDSSVGDRAVAVSQNVPLILRGDSPVIAKSPQITADVDEDLLARLEDLYSKDEWFAARLSEAMGAEKLVDDAQDGNPMASMMAAKTGGSERVASLARMAAVLMRSEGGPQIAVFEATGWDTHANQGAARGVLAQRLGGLDHALQTLSQELGAIWSRTAVLVVTEFGRTAAMNGTRGTDHGTGSCAFLAGGAVRGGRVISDWPGLSRSALLDGRDLKPTLDLRSVFKAVLGEHLRIDAKSLDAKVFPDSTGARPLPGLMRA
jgi:uncharacterized protein (DUF1501 family)